MQSWEDDNTFCRGARVLNSSQHQHCLWVTTCFAFRIPHCCLMLPSGRDLSKLSHMILRVYISVTMSFSRTKVSLWATTRAKAKTWHTYSYEVHLCFSNPWFATFLAATVIFKQIFQQRKYQRFGKMKKKWLPSQERQWAVLCLTKVVWNRNFLYFQKKGKIVRNLLFLWKSVENYQLCFVSTVVETNWIGQNSCEPLLSPSYFVLCRSDWWKKSTNSFATFLQA